MGLALQIFCDTVCILYIKVKQIQKEKDTIILFMITIIDIYLNCN